MSDITAWLQARLTARLDTFDAALDAASGASTADDPAAYHAAVRTALWESVHAAAVAVALTHLRDNGGTPGTLPAAIRAGIPVQAVGESKDTWEARRRAYACEAVTILQHARPDLAVVTS